MNPPLVPSLPTGVTTITYTPTDDSFANPERGFYHYIETRASAPTPSDLDAFRAYRETENITLLYCINYLDDFVDSPISPDFLAHLQANLDTVRGAGLKCVLRFAYTDDWNNEQPPFGDATKAQILMHIDQLEPILRANSDVIAAMQAGFIGVWGEWYYTDHFVDNSTVPWEISPDQYANRYAVLSHLLAALPVTRTVALRYPATKQQLFQVTTPLTTSQAFAGSEIARTGFHNDCFLADASDYGTYREEDIEADKTYLAAETAYLPMGGETCNPNPPRSECPTALAELTRFHWSYLNSDYHPDVFAGWISGGCLGEMQRRLGYRFVLQQGAYTPAAKPGDAVSIQLDLINVGFAAPFNPRPVELLLRATNNGERYRVRLSDDPRFWLPGGATHTISATVGLLPTMPNGEYELLLSLPAPETSLADRTEYAIRLANENVWESTTGYNRLLHTLQVTTTTSGSVYGGDLIFMPVDAITIEPAKLVYLPMISQ
jgi:hypothetical protein